MKQAVSRNSQSYSDLLALKNKLTGFAKKHETVFYGMNDRIRNNDPVHFTNNHTIAMKIHRKGNRVGSITINYVNGRYCIDSGIKTEYCKDAETTYKKVFQHIVMVYETKTRVKAEWGNRRYAPQFNI